MNANCLDNKGDFKHCPYRVLTEEHKAVVVGHGDITTQEFYQCEGEGCIAYHVGICLRAHEALSKLREN